MTTDAYRFEPGRPVMAVRHAFLHSLILRENHRYATLSEYAQAAGLDVATLIDLLGEHLDTGLVTLEPAGDEVFVLTAPHGRPIPRTSPDVAPNLWELLRSHSDRHEAYRNWQLVRRLERAGWETVVASARIAAGLTDPTRLRLPLVGIWVGHAAMPVLDEPTPHELVSGLLERYELAGAACVAVTTRSGHLDDAITAVRAWALSRPTRPRLNVLVLEAPRFDPVLVTASDPAVPYKAVDRLTLRALDQA